MKYTLSFPQPASKYIEIEMQIENISGDTFNVQLPSWRPGRYELGNFAKNIQRFNVFDENGKELKYKKTTKDNWEIGTNNIQKIIVRYNYFASQMDAGGCWLDHEQLCVNPIQCFLYNEERQKESCEIELKISPEWNIATSLKKKDKKILLAKNFDELVDSPFIASPNLKSHSYKVNGISFNIWIQGECKPDWNRIENDFKKFTEEEIKMMGNFPADEYHFLIQVLPYNFYHGVEHCNSTVLAISPGYELMNEKLYPELIGLASHELFHVWNVKNIRPADMLPYNYSKENYSQLGYVYEGFTTYYGDLFLARCGFFSLEQYLKEITTHLQKHIDNYGRFNYSVAQSSFDTWLDGYVSGVPGRKTSIYTEGSLIALMLDYMIRKSSSNNKSLDDVMRRLYHDFGKKNIGYAENDIQKIAEDVSQRSFEEFFDNYVYSAVSYESLFEELLLFAGLKITKTPSQKSYERLFGFRIEQNGVTRVANIIPSSPAEISGMMKDDEIIYVNDCKVENNLDQLFSYFEGNEITLGVFSNKKHRETKLKPSDKIFYNRYQVVLLEQRSEEQKKFLKMWCGF